MAVRRKHRRRKSRRANPYDRHGFWHSKRGLYARPRRRGGKMAAKRSRFTSRLARRRRHDRRGRFLNPALNNPLTLGTMASPFANPRKKKRTKKKAAHHRRPKSGSMKKRRVTRRRRNPVTTLVLANPFKDKKGRLRRNDGKFAKKRKSKSRKSKSRKSRKSKSRKLSPAQRAHLRKLAAMNRRRGAKRSRRKPGRTMRRTSRLPHRYV